MHYLRGHLLDRIVVVMSWLEIFFKNVLGFTNRLDRQFLIAHLLGSPRN